MFIEGHLLEGRTARECCYQTKEKPDANIHAGLTVLSEVLESALWIQVCAARVDARRSELRGPTI
ncbi:MAG: hypothetical protein Aurels2KO_17620 [Aureliella sp.]